MKRILPLIFTIALSGCAFMHQSIPINTKIDSAAYLNPNSNGQPAPVVITLYQLKDKSAFETADYNSLESDPNTTLSSAFIDRSQVEIRPNHSKDFRIRIAKAAKYIGLTAGYMNLEKSKWKKILTVPDNLKCGSISIQLLSQQLVSSKINKSFLCFIN